MELYQKNSIENNHGIGGPRESSKPREAKAMQDIKLATPQLKHPERQAVMHAIYPENKGEKDFIKHLIENPKIIKEVEAKVEKLNEKTSEFADNITEYLSGTSEIELPYQLRPHQVEALKKTAEMFAQNRLRGYVSHPTGTGKTILFCSIAKTTQAKKILVLVPKIILGSQTLDNLSKFFPEKSISYNYTKQSNIKNYKKGLGGDIVVAVDQTFKNKTKKFAEQNFDLVICDEAHNYCNGNMQRAINQLGPIPTLAFSATPHYSYADKPGKNSIPITTTSGATVYVKDSVMNYFPNKIDEISLKDAIENNLLAPLAATIVKVDVDMSGLKLSGQGLKKDYSKAELAKLMNKHKNAIKFQEAAIRKYIEGIETEDGIIQISDKKIFCACTTQEQAINLASAFEERVKILRPNQPVRTACITSRTPQAKRDQILQDYKEGKIQILTSVDVLAEGWDDPGAEVCFMMRPTKSLTKYQQIVGRVLRLNPEDADKTALLVDFHGKCIDEESNTTKLDQLQINPIDLFGISVAKNLKKIKKKKDKEIIDYSQVEIVSGLRTTQINVENISVKEEGIKALKINGKVYLSTENIKKALSFFRNKKYQEVLDELLDDSNGFQKGRQKYYNLIEVADAYYKKFKPLQQNDNYLRTRSACDVLGIKENAIFDMAFIEAKLHKNESRRNIAIREYDERYYDYYQEYRISRMFEVIHDKIKKLADESQEKYSNYEEYMKRAEERRKKIEQENIEKEKAERERRKKLHQKRKREEKKLAEEREKQALLREKEIKELRKKEFESNFKSAMERVKSGQLGAGEFVYNDDRDQWEFKVKKGNNVIVLVVDRYTSRQPKNSDLNYFFTINRDKSLVKGKVYLVDLVGPYPENIPTGFDKSLWPKYKSVDEEKIIEKTKEDLPEAIFKQHFYQGRPQWQFYQDGVKYVVGKFSQRQPEAGKKYKYQIVKDLGNIAFVNLV